MAKQGVSCAIGDNNVRVKLKHKGFQNLTIFDYHGDAHVCCAMVQKRNISR